MARLACYFVGKPYVSMGLSCYWHPPSMPMPIPIPVPMSAQGCFICETPIIINSTVLIVWGDYNLPWSTQTLEKTCTPPMPATCVPSSNTAMQVVALQLGKGHKAAALCTARLPSSSISALHRLPGQPAPEKEFVIVASYLEAARATGPGLGRPQGLLSIFDVCPAGPAGSAAGR